MSTQTESRFQIVDSRQRHVGDIAIERSEGSLVFGKFAPERAFSEVEQLFREFEEAANLQALHRIDELDAAIAALGLHLRSLDGAQELAIRDVQIWSDGAITCRLLDSALYEVNGRL